MMSIADDRPLFAVPCVWGHEVSKFRHAFLRNTCCGIPDPTLLAQALKEKRDGVSVAGAAEASLSHILAEIHSGPSPAQLVIALCAAPETPPLEYFESLSMELRQDIFSAVQRAFERDFRPEYRAAKILGDGQLLFAVIHSFLAQPTVANMTSVQQAAACLYSSMRSLPGGIWLWDDKPDDTNTNSGC